MTRSVPVIISLVITGLAATACGSDDDPTSLTVVTHDAFVVSDEVIEAFEDQTGISVTFLTSADVGTLVTEAVLTKDNPTADLLFGIDNTFLSRGLDEGLFRPHQSPALEQVPVEFQLDSEYRVTPVDYGDVCINVWDDASEGPTPRSLDDFRESEFAARWVTENPETSSPGLALLLATIARYGEDGWEEFWGDAAEGGIGVTAGWTEAYYGDFVAGGGDRSVVTSYATSPVAEVVFSETPVDTPPTSIITDSCFRQIEFAGVLTNAANPEAAEMFIDFMLSDTFQNDVPLNMFVYPVSSSAILPAVFEEHATPVPESLTLDPARIGEMRDQWTERWVEIVLR